MGPRLQSLSANHAFGAWQPDPGASSGRDYTDPRHVVARGARCASPQHIDCHQETVMKLTTFLMTALLSLVLASGALANTFGSVEPIANPAVLDTGLLQRQPLGVREAFARQLLQCGIVDQVIEALAETHAVNTINGLNTRFEVGAGGF